MEVGGNPLGELMQLWRQQQVAQLGLADQDQLQDLKLVRIDIGNHAQVLERLRLEILRLVDDQDGSSSVGILAIQKILQLLEKIRIISIERLTERHQDPLQQFLPALGGIRDQADRDRRADLLQQCRTRVVLPDPISPVMTVKPALFMTPNSSIVNAIECILPQ